MVNNVDIPSWLEGLPLAPEYRPTDTEFADPIAYISRIEKEASAFGICKIIPPLPKPSKKYVFSNLNKSLVKCPDLGSDVDLSNVSSSSRMSSNEGEIKGFFTTRHQELGQSVKRSKGVISNDNQQIGVHKQVWQSGEVYTLEQFESKSKVFARGLLSLIKEVSPLVIEALFWKAASEKPMYIEYANDVPGSAFGEPEGQFRYFHRRRRKMKSWKSYRSSGTDDEKNSEIDNLKSSHKCVGTNDFVEDDAKTCSQPLHLSLDSLSVPLDDNSQSVRRKNVHGSIDVEGTAGWKLSNSPWNLQVIARSPGSLTRFMPDDIPGVTSPMVYIGMLFSWFAWHVEDHELHSMNFLHTGAAKTWYSVPGDYACAFEEVIRSEAYGGNIDRLAALALLGEKTTLVNPEIIVASSIPCCRLVQNPGEFVVTFPRAYHTGFSHGFNCGEAANFGTPQWLKVAKEAAVRRAAMNYLPMLSHQQLLYLLTMSFVSRVPRSLLPGARSSRLRDRQKEERELLVKKAFIQDILIQNNTLCTLIGQESSSCAVLWHPDLLACQSKDVQLTPESDAVHTEPGEKDSHIQSEKDKSQKDLLNEMSLYMETLNDLYLDDHDMLCDFQTDSGTLPCVACGILGFPFMSVVQLSEQASMELLVNQDLACKGPGISESKIAHPYFVLDGTVSSSISEEHSPVPETSVPLKDLPVPSVSNFRQKWNTSSKFLRPRIFCLEHALQIKELMRAKGGANILVICHSDFQKMKAHAAVIAEEIGTPFNYIDFQLDSASPEDMQLIDLAIDEGENDRCREDWTTKLDINLRHCVKVKKNSSSKRVQHALSLAGLVSERSPSSDFSTISWQSRRCRTKTKLKSSAQSKLQMSIEGKADELVLNKSNDIEAKREEQIIQYSRRKRQAKQGSPAADSCRDGHSRKLLFEGTSVATCSNLFDHNGTDSNISSCDIVNTDIMIGNHDLVSEVQNNLATEIDASVNDVSGIDSLIENRVQDNSSTEDEVQPQIQEKSDGDPLSCYDKQIKLPLPASKEGCEDLNDARPGNCLSQQDHLLPEIDFAPVKSEEHIFTSVRLLKQSDPVSVEGSEISVQKCVTVDLCNAEIPENEKLALGSCTIRGRKDGLVSGPVTCVEINSASPDSVERFSDIPRGRADVSDSETRAKFCTAAGTGVAALDSSVHIEGNVVAVEACAERSNGNPTQKQTTHKKPLEDARTSNSANETPKSSSVLAMDQPLPAVIKTYSRTRRESGKEKLNQGNELCPEGNRELESNNKSTVEDAASNAGKGRKRNRELEMITKDLVDYSGFIRSPCEGLRPRTASKIEVDTSELPEEKPVKKTSRKESNDGVPAEDKKKAIKGGYKCDIDGCRMRFQTKRELSVHKNNRCPYEGCGKKFSSHKYAIIHQRVHDDDRPLKCPWEGCTMSFKWAWARTEHIRVHTGERPYQCKVECCGLSFRFVSDISRHRRKTGHYENTSS